MIFIIWDVVRVVAKVTELMLVPTSQVVDVGIGVSVHKNVKTFIVSLTP